MYRPVTAAPAAPGSQYCGTKLPMKYVSAVQMKAALKYQSDTYIARSWRRIVQTHEVSREAMDKLVAGAQAVGFLRGVPDLARLIEKP